MRIGILGAGQLGRMLALAGYPLGLEFRFWQESEEPPEQTLAECVCGPYTDADLLHRFISGVDVVTYEFENVPVELARRLSRTVAVHPSPRALEAAQDRLNEKTLFRELGIPVPEFAPVQSAAELRQAVERIGLPAVLKTRRFGYDGKGQVMLREAADVELTGRMFDKAPVLLEEFVPFERELSILVARGRNKQTVFYPLVENRHHQGILRQSRAPAPGCTAEWQHLAEGHARRILEAVDYVGVLAVEFFQYQGRLLANEMAPRVHNSGHWTIEGARTSQFANHVRAVLGLPLGSAESLGHSVMLNLIGEVPALPTLLSIPGVNVHLYGKTPQPGRKLGHLTVTEADEGTLQERLARLRGRTDLPGLWLENL
jgi:5-(carboxyamino)imidazole ribonucleotide synthase